MSVREQHLEILMAVTLIALAAFLGWGALVMPMGTVALPGPGFLPAVLSGLIGIVGILLLARSMRSSAHDLLAQLGNRDVLVALVALGACGFLFERAGYLISAALLLFVLFWTWSPLGMWRSLAASLVSAVLADLFFVYLLGVNLPGSPFGLF